MSLPDVNPKESVSGITIDPYTHERVIPESRRADGSVRQQRRVRPGYTPQEDVSLFRGSRQTVAAAQNRKAPGYLPPGAAPRPAAASTDKPLSKSAAKNAKRRAKKQAEKEEAVRDNWDSDSDGGKGGKKKASDDDKDVADKATEGKDEGGGETNTERKAKKDADATTSPQNVKDAGSELTAEVAKLDLGS